MGSILRRNGQFTVSGRLQESGSKMNSLQCTLLELAKDGRRRDVRKVILSFCEEDDISHSVFIGIHSH